MDGKTSAFLGSGHVRIGPGHFQHSSGLRPTADEPATPRPIEGRAGWGGIWRPDPETQRAIARGDMALARHRAKLRTGKNPPTERAIQEELDDIRKELETDIREVMVQVRREL